MIWISCLGSFVKLAFCNLNDKIFVRFFVYFLFFSTISVSLSQAADVRTNAEGETIYFILQGEIEQGDLEQLAGEYNILASFGLINGRAMKLLLNSKGGNLIEAMKLGQFVRTIGLVTMVDNTMTFKKMRDV